MKKSDTPVSTQGTFVVVATFVKMMTVKAKSVSHAQDVAEEAGLLSPDGAGLSNWHGHEV